MSYLLYAVCAAYLFRSRSFRRLVASATRAQKCVVVTVLIGFFGAQLIRKSQETYPFVSWSMYSRTSDHVRFDEYRGVRPDGTEFPLPVAQFVRTRDQRLAWLLVSYARQIERSGDEQLREIYTETLRAAWEIYRLRNPGVAATEIRVYAVDVPIAEYQNRDALPRRLRWTIEP